MIQIIIIAVVVFVIIMVSKMGRGSIKYSAVQNAYHAKFTYQKLSENQKENVNNKTFEILTKGGMLKKDFDRMSEIVQYSFMGLAMNELGINPALQNEKWHYVNNPYMALQNSDHQVNVIKNDLLKNHDISIEMKN